MNQCAGTINRKLTTTSALGRVWARSRRQIVALIAALAMALGVSACDRTVVLPSPLRESVDRAGLHLELASVLDVPTVTREAAAISATEAMRANADRGRLTRITLVTVTGPGNPRLGWDPTDHQLVYAAEWTDGTTLGLTLVSARTGEVLLVTAY